MGFVAETGSGHTIAMDGAPDEGRPENGGRNLAPRPMETVLAGTGGCTAYDVVLILKRGRHDVRGCTVRLTAERAEVDPKVFTKINLHFTVTGKDIPAQAVERAVAMSHDKYCSATIMLAKTADITTTFDVVPTFTTPQQVSTSLTDKNVVAKVAVERITRRAAGEVVIPQATFSNDAAVR
jgi:putative redox protein